jgi:hypothetical protein
MKEDFFVEYYVAKTDKIYQRKEKAGPGGKKPGPAGRGQGV